MARQLRFQYAGAVYHVMARGDGGKQIFIRKEDHESFLYWLEKVCESHGWRVHAWVLMGNHFHLKSVLTKSGLASPDCGVKVGLPGLSWEGLMASIAKS